MDGADPDRWSAVAADWAELWGGFARPAWTSAIAASGVGPGSRVLDVGCGSGDLLAHLQGLGMQPAGIDPAPGMVAVARERAPGCDIRLGVADDLPWPDDTFDLVTSFNALQFAERDVLTELTRVTAQDGSIAVANWAEDRHNDLATIEAAVADAADEDLPPENDLRVQGGLERFMRDAGLRVVSTGIVELPWLVGDPETLVHGVLLGEDDDTIMDRRSDVLTAATPFRTPAGGYRLVNHFRYAVARLP